jgi:hypothetical protein
MRARYVVVRNTENDPLVIRDVGVECMSITNDAEAVVEDLWGMGMLPPGRRVFYYDSNGDLDELLIEDGRFAGFKVSPRGGV